MTRYAFFIAGGSWGAILASVLTEHIEFLILGFALGIFGAAFLFGLSELLDPIKHKKFDEKYPLKPKPD